MWVTIRYIYAFSIIRSFHIYNFDHFICPTNSNLSNNFTVDFHKVLVKYQLTTIQTLGLMNQLNV